MDNTYKRTKSTETGSWKLAGWSRSRGPPPRPPLLEEDWRLTPIRYYDFLDLFVQEYYSYCDDFFFFGAEFLGASELGNHHHLQETNAGLKGKKKKHIRMRDEYWMIILVNSLFCHYFISMGGDWWRRGGGGRCRPLKVVSQN